MKKQNKIYLGIGIVAIVLLIGINYFAFNSQEESIKIGAIGTMTGIGSFFGQQEIRGLEVAKDIINSEGGINGRKIELIAEDSQTKNEVTISAYNKLKNIDGVKFIIGDSWTATSEALVPVLDNDVLVFSPTATISSLTKDDSFFRTSPLIKDMSYFLANYTYSLGIKKVAIVSCTISFCSEHADFFKEEFERLGGEVVETQIIQLGQEDVKTELLKIKNKNPEAIFIPMSSTAMVSPLRQIKEFGMNVTLLGSFGTESNSLVKDYSDISEGVLYPYFYDENSDSPENMRFINAYKSKYNSLPDSTAVSSYDAMFIIADAIANVGENPIKAKEYILKKEYESAGGHISFDENGDAQKALFIKQIENGKFIRVN